MGGSVLPVATVCGSGNQGMTASLPILEYAKDMGLEIGKEIFNASDEICQLAVQGPLALKAMQKLTSANVVDMEYYTFQKCDFAGIKDVIAKSKGSSNPHNVVKATFDALLQISTCKI